MDWHKRYPIHFQDGGADIVRDSATLIICPVCQREEVHFCKTLTDDGCFAEAAPELVRGNDNYDAGWGGRGDALAIPFVCESGHTWKTVFAFHKGTTCAFLDVPPGKVESTESPIERWLFEALPDALQKDVVLQYPIGPYRADFALPSAKLVIECDGHDYHKTKEQRTHDAKRDRYMKANGWDTIRFTGSEIYQNSGQCALEVEELYRKLFKKPELA